jgi:hypothetical protein
LLGSTLSAGRPGRPRPFGRAPIEYDFALSRRGSRPSFAKLMSLENWRAQGKPGARCTRSLACESDKAHERSHHRFTGNTQPSLRNGFNGYFVLSPVTGLFCHRRSRIQPATLTPASGRQDHTTSPSALRRSSCDTAASTASRATFVTMANVPSRARRRKL